MSTPSPRITFGFQVRAGSVRFRSGSVRFGRVPFRFGQVREVRSGSSCVDDPRRTGEQVVDGPLAIAAPTFPQRQLSQMSLAYQ